MDTIRLTEATINLRDGQLLGDLLRSLETMAVAAVSALLPPAKQNDRGELPYQYVNLADVLADAAMVRAVRYGYGATESERFSRTYRVPWTSDDGDVSVGTPEEVAMRIVYEPVTAETSTQESVDVGALRRRILRAFVDPSRRAAVEREADAALKSTRVTESTKAAVRLDLEDLRAGRRGPAVDRHRNAGLLAT